MRHKPAGGGKCETGKCGTKMQDMKMQDWKMRHKAAQGGKCRNGKSGKRSMTQDTEVEVAHVNRGMSIRRSKNKSNLRVLNDAQIQASISH